MKPELNNEAPRERMEPSSQPAIAEASCPVVGIGASAGGIKVLQEFFSTIPADIDVAFVVVVHLDPERHSDLSRILATHTKMPVVEVVERMPLKAGHVYVIAPNRQLLIADHEISSAAFNEPRGHRAPIDLFFRSLAEQRGDGCAIVLTGAGSDGAVGVKAVKEHGGLILVQDPQEAEYPSMPRAAIATGLADLILPIRDIAAQLQELMASKKTLGEQLATLDEDFVRRILAHLRARTGHDFSQYKRSTVLRRLARRMQVHHVEQLSDYLTLFWENIEEMQALFSDLLISVTTFFRDRPAFDTLAGQVIPHLFEGKNPSDTIRVWVPGCATGEEAYSLAILLLEETARRGVHPALQVFASDLDTGALSTGREGLFPASIEADVSEERLRRFFIREGDHYRIKKDVRDIVLFASHSLLKDPPFSRLDLVSCRNLLIYLDRDLQQQVLAILHYALIPGGYLFLGSSESADSAGGAFQVVDRDARIFRASEARRDRSLVLHSLPITPGFPSALETHLTARPPPTADAAIHGKALEEHAPPSVLVDEQFQILHVSETAGRYLFQPRGPVTTDLTELVRPELRFAVRAALNRFREQGRGTLSLPTLVQFESHARQVYVQIRPAQREHRTHCAIVLFIEGEEIDPIALQSEALPLPDTLAEPLQRVYDELQATRASLKTSIEEHERASEDLRAANEELQSINEEYRSTAEDLETSKEELQSVNEELNTVNNELKLKLESVSRAHSDLQNLISATDVGTLFLDTDLHIQRFTPRVADIFNIAPGDIGRPITNFTHRMTEDRLTKDVQSVLETLNSLEYEIETDSGQWYLVRARPYRTVDNRIEGVVVTFVDVTVRRQAESDLRESQTRLKLAQEAVGLGIHDFNPMTNELWWDNRSRELWGLRPTDPADIAAFWTGIHPDDVASVRRAKDAALATNGDGHYEAEFRVRSRIGSGEHWVRVTGKAFFEGSEESRRAIRLVSTVQNVSDRKLWELSQKTLLRELSHRVKNTLGVVQAMARQTFRTCGAEPTALPAFEARLAALSRAHDMLVESEWQGADLQELTRQQISGHLSDVLDRFTLSGPPVTMPASLATPFALLIHELATNALKYGALSRPEGAVTLAWRLSSRNGEQLLSLVWEERGGPPVGDPATPGFGSFLIERGLPEAIVHRDFRPEGLVCVIEVPLHGTATS